MDRGRNRPATHAEVEEVRLGGKDYLHTGPNRWNRRAAVSNRFSNTKHNNRKETKSRKTVRVELEKAVITKDQRVITVKTGIYRSVRIIRNYLQGGFRTSHS